jgi:hypothetical protein
MLIQMIVIFALALVAALAAAYLLGEWRGSRTLYEPLPSGIPHTPSIGLESIVSEQEMVDNLEESISVELLPPVTSSDLEQIDALLGQINDDAVRAGTLAVRYRREALVTRKRLDAAVAMLMASRRPSQEAISAAVVEVNGREVPVLPKGMVRG